MMKEMVGGCCVCADENGWTDNPLIYCDGENCDVAVHQGCYGIQEVPEGEWFCAKCTAAGSMIPGSINEDTFCCQLCPFDYGALKRTDRNQWAHVICALYIPEVRFGNVHSMEPVILSDVPVDKFHKTCYICNEERPNDAKKGACMSCNKSTCKRSFHVTCAQRKGLLCEEGAISRNVKYCGYCESHLKKAINDPAIKVIPACPPVQRLAIKEHQESKKSKKILLTPPPPPPPLPPPPPSSQVLVAPLPPPPVPPVLLAPNRHMLVEPAPRNSVLALNDAPPTAFSPPLTTSSRSSVVPTPPLSASAGAAPPKVNALTSSGPLIIPSTPSSAAPLMANGSSLPETTVGTHCLQQLQIHTAAQAAAATLAQNNAMGGGGHDLNGYPAASQLSSFMHEIPARNTTSVASLLPPGAAEFHLNGNGDEEKTVKAVLTAPLTKAKRMRDSKNEMLDKATKRPRAHPRAPPSSVLGGASSSSGGASGGGGTVGKSASMQRLINLVAPVVSETVTDFQRDRIAAAERRAAAAQSQPSTSTTNGVGTTVPAAGADGHQNNASAGASSIPGTSTNDSTITQNGTTPVNSSGTSHGARLNLPSFMEQLLERQWDQGSGLLMANAHFDVAQLLSCLFQLKAENSRLEENLSGLRKRRDHLYSLNARLNEMNALEMAKRQNPNQQNPLLLNQELIPKIETKESCGVPLPSNHTAPGHFEEIKKGRKSTVPTTVAPIPMSAIPLTTAAALTTTTANSAAALVQNHRATPSTAGAPLAPTPVISTAASNDLAALSPERVANQTHAALMNIYRTMPTMDPNMAAQLSMISNFPGSVNPTTALFSRLLAQPTIQAAVSMMNGGLQPNSQPILPPSATPNGK